MEEIFINTTKKNQVINITEEVIEAMKKEKERKKLDEGICIIYVPHATAAVTVNENWDESVCDDFLDALSNLIPEGKWKHDKVDGNGAAHIKSAIIGPSVAIPFKDERLLLGTWQGIMLCEFDGPRKRKVIVICK